MSELLTAETTARKLLALSRELWRAPAHDRSEPQWHAFRRLFGVNMGVPIVFLFFQDQGRPIVVRLYTFGRITVSAPEGFQIRQLVRPSDEIANRTEALAGRGDRRIAPTFATFQRQLAR